jgi:hypothetical protein
VLQGAGGLRRKATTIRSRSPLEHDREKWTPVFAKDHAQTKSWTAIVIQSQAIAV